MDVEAVFARIRQALADGKDLRLLAVPAACAGFPLIEFWDEAIVEVFTTTGAIAERQAPSLPSPEAAAGPGRRRRLQPPRDAVSKT